MEGEATMRMPILLIGVAIVMSAPPLQAEQSPRAATRRQAAVDRDRVAVDGEIRVVFSTREVEIIREHYAPRYTNLPPGLRNLPPGLQKKLERTGKLPPGWQKKMQSFPVALTRRLPSLPDGYARGVIDGRAVIYVPGTSQIIDATVLF